MRGGGDSNSTAKGRNRRKLSSLPGAGLTIGYFGGCPRGDMVTENIPKSKPRSLHTVTVGPIVTLRQADRNVR